MNNCLFFNIHRVKKFKRYKSKSLYSTIYFCRLCEITVCERKYNGYYSYGDCGGQNGVNSFEECCELAKAANINRRLENRAEIIRFSWNGNRYVHLGFNSRGFNLKFFNPSTLISISFIYSCAFKCGGTQDNRGGSWWSSAEDISTCTCN